MTTEHMTEKVQSRKKIYQLAKEINISHETLLEYLRKRGHEVKSHMSVVDDSMMHDILSHFKKDKEVAEKHQRKIQTIRETRKKAETKAASAKAVAEEEISEKAVKRAKTEKLTEVPPVQPHELPQVPAEPVAEAPAVSEIAVEVPPVPEEEAAEVIAPAAEAPVLVAEPPVETAAPEKAEVPVEEPRKEEIAPPAKAKQKEAHPDILPRRTPKMGLRIKGKIDLEEVKRAHAILEGTGAPAKEAAEEDAKKKKKKKKRIRTEPTVAAPTEEVDTAARKSKKKKKVRFREVDKEEVEEAIKRTLAEMDEATPVVQRATFKRKRKEKRMIEE